MEPRFQTSFIPKKSIIEAAKLRSSPSPSRNIYSMAATAIFALTLIACLGLFFYKNLLSNQIAQDDKELNLARVAFQVETIQDLVDANSRIIAIKGLLNKHVVTSELLTLLQSLTVKNVRFTDFLYNNKNNVINLSMDVEGKTYNALAMQSDIFSKNEFVKEESFSDFSLDINGNVKSKFSGKLDSKLVSYKKAIESQVPQ